MPVQAQLPDVAEGLIAQVMLRVVNALTTKKWTQTEIV